MPRRHQQQDPIAEQSERLCEYMNGRPATVLSYARYFGEYPNASKATMTSIDQDGFDITCQDGDQHHEVRVTFGYTIHAVSQVKDALMTLSTEAETALRGKDPKNKQGLMPDSPSVTVPLDPLISILLLLGTMVFYLDFFPNTTSPLLQWVLHTVGPVWIHRTVLITVAIHVFETIVSLYFSVIVGKGFFSISDIIQWTIAVFIFGYPCLFKVIGLSRRYQAKNKTN